jgi:hypothetical protein
MDAAGNVDCTSSSNDLAGFKSSLGNTDGVMERSG